MNDVRLVCVDLPVPSVGLIKIFGGITLKTLSARGHLS
jgi:hypothetical protein